MLDLDAPSSAIGTFGIVNSPASNSNNQPQNLRRRLTPSNASHTYSVRAFVSSGTGLIGAGAGGSGTAFPAFIRVWKFVP